MLALRLAEGIGLLYVASMCIHVEALEDFSGRECLEKTASINTT